MVQIVINIYSAGNNSRTRKAKVLLEEAVQEAGYNVKITVQTIDILKNISLAEEKKILALPTICRQLPSPEKRVIGTVDDAAKAKKIIEFLIHDISISTSHARK